MPRRLCLMRGRTRHSPQHLRYPRPYPPARTTTSAPPPAMPSDTDDDGSVSQSVVIQTDYTEYCSDTEYSGVEDETAVTVGWSIGGRLSF
eukprot:COSAG01_NODE_208_length_21996_cov_31.972097_11_plen_90_part_00